MRKDNNEVLISSYSDKEAQPSEIAVAVKKLSVAFPKMSAEFWNVLSERIAANEFTGVRLKESVEYILDNFQYKELNISDIIRFDKRIKLYTYSEVVRMIEKGEVSGFDEFKIKEIDGEYYRIKISDIIN